MPHQEHLPPDVGAAKLWLSRRQPEKWRERQEVNVTGSLERRLSQMTPEERGRYALELAERARRRLVEAGMTIEHERKVGDGEATEVDEDRAPSASVGTGRIS